MGFNIVDSRSGRLGPSPDLAAVRFVFLVLSGVFQAVGRFADGAGNRSPTPIWLLQYGIEQGRLVRLGGLYHHVTLWGTGAVDVNYASIELLKAAGLSDSLIETIVRIRSQRPIEVGDGTSGGDLQPSTRISGSVGLGGAQAYTLWATARVRKGRAKRMLGALVQQGLTAGPFRMHVTRWYDTGF